MKASIPDRPIHLAAHIRRDGAVSPRCAKTPRKLNLRVETWTLRREAATCAKCLAWEEEPEASAQHVARPQRLQARDHHVEALMRGEEGA